MCGQLVCAKLKLNYSDSLQNRHIYRFLPKQVIYSHGIYSNSKIKHSDTPQKCYNYNFLLLNLLNDKNPNITNRFGGICK